MEMRRHHAQLGGRHQEVTEGTRRESAFLPQISGQGTRNADESGGSGEAQVEEERVRNVEDEIRNPPTLPRSLPPRARTLMSAHATGRRNMSMNVSEVTRRPPMSSDPDQVSCAVRESSGVHTVGNTYSRYTYSTDRQRVEGRSPRPAGCLHHLHSLHRLDRPRQQIGVSSNSLRPAARCRLVS
nr:hypothetical protein CFP56_00940 [Quercus suber]